MQQFLIYEIKVAIVMATFYMFYRLMLSREKLHRLNRCVLVGTVIASFLLPLCIITVHRSISVPTQLLLPQMDDTGFRVQFNGEEMENPFNWLTVIFAIYCAGIAAILMKVAIDIIKLRKLILKGEKHHDESGITLVVLDTNISPFSWMNYIFLSREDYGTGNNHIMEHERAHIRFGHAKELLCMEILSSLQWFNPAMWFLKSDLKSIYEYEADDAVLQSGANIKDYQYSLIRKAVSASGYSITNSFNHSILKNRITMMSKPKVSAMTGLRALYILPLLCGALALNAKTVFDYEISENLSVQQNPIKIEVKLENDKPVYYINGDKTNIDELGEKGANLIKNNEFGVVQLVVDRYVKMGTLSDLKEELRKIGALNIEYFTVAPNENTESVTFQSIEVKPKFNGGDANEFSKWVIAHLEYPAEARAAGKQGRVMVKFTVNEDGKVSDVSVLRGIDPALDAEAVRVVNSSPNWKPGEKDGKKVPVTYTFPVIFQLSSPNMEKTGM